MPQTERNVPVPVSMLLVSNVNLYEPGLPSHGSVLEMGP